MGIRTLNLTKTLGDPPTPILKNISLEIQDGDYVSVTGRSGSGKSTLLYLLSSLDHTLEGKVEIDGQDVNQMSAEALSLFRNKKAGFVFQFHYLVAELTAMENVLLPARKSGGISKRREIATTLFEQFGLKDKIHRLPRHLSGGEQQRVAIARALVMEPRYLFADEPTGSLDSENSEIVLNLLEKANEKQKTTLILVTHDPGFSRRARRQIHLVDGQFITP
ncbi:MAG: ABC transporter ATP-binding protein [Candidatus Omnitrophica bacterium]|nr:ABC transporter ATP-binding protein [Candidatus Omnitrophota bacterium]